MGFIKVEEIGREGPTVYFNLSGTGPAGVPVMIYYTEVLYYTNVGENKRIGPHSVLGVTMNRTTRAPIAIMFEGDTAARFPDNPGAAGDRNVFRKLDEEQMEILKAAMSGEMFCRPRDLIRQIRETPLEKI